MAIPERPLWRRVLSFPSTRLGWSALALTVGFFGFYSVFLLLLRLGQRGGAHFFSNPWLAASVIAMAACGIAGGAVSAVAIFRNRERSLLMLPTLLWGVFVFVFLIGELATPH